ncbi:MAG TPA: PA2169 family four-helix-bundle protein [Bacteroidia bacterium]|jgi:uncharacterized protein (TIGR02284 family)|nr:PA2169 family four-helix-bundle protein [Bacteroidia bacterium]
MENTNEKLISLINNLVEINNDRITGYETAAKETDDSSLKGLFVAMSTESHAFKSELAGEVILLGGKPTEGTRNSGKMYRVWMDIKAALTGKDRKAIINSCEFGEDAALQAYDDVLKSENMIPARIRDIIGRQKQKLQLSHNKIKALRDMVKA